MGLSVAVTAAVTSVSKTAVYVTTNGDDARQLHARLEIGRHPGPRESNPRTACLQIADHQWSGSPPCSDGGP